MCRFCFASFALVVAGTVSTGGLAALAINASLKRREATDGTQNTNEIINPDLKVDHHPKEFSTMAPYIIETKKNVIQQNCMKWLTAQQ